MSSKISSTCVLSVGDQPVDNALPHLNVYMPQEYDLKLHYMNIIYNDSAESFLPDVLSDSIILRRLVLKQGCRV